MLTALDSILYLSVADTIGTSKECPLERGVRCIEVLTKLAHFASKTCSSVLGYSAIEFKVCQKVDVRRRKSLKTVY